MIPHPSKLPEMRDLKVSTAVIREVEAAEAKIAAQIEALTSGEPVHGTSMDYVNNALLVTCFVGFVSPAAQWVLRQRCLAHGWDELEFYYAAGSDYEIAGHFVLLVEHKFPAAPRTLVKPPVGYIQD